MVGQDSDHILVVKIARVAQVRFDQVIVILREIARAQPPDMPAGQSSRALVHVLLCIMTKAKCEQFHQFARIVFVWRPLRALGQIEVEEHGRVARNPQQDSIKGIERMLAQKLVLHDHTHIGS